MNELAKIPQFEGKSIRSTLHEGELYFVVTDVVTAIVETKNANDYLKKIRRRDKELSKGWGQIVTPLPVETEGGKQRMNCANREGLFRIIQAIPSPKAEPFKQWLAKVGAERVEEVEDPMKAIDRAREYYQKKGYDKEWINRRIQSKGIRHILTEEWKERGVDDPRQFGLLTNEIHQGAFDLTVKDHKEHKGLKRQNLRDHMTLTELAITILGEASTAEIAQSRDAQGFNENKDAAQDGGKIAGDARRQIEAQTGRKVVSRKNFLKRLGGKEGE